MKMLPAATTLTAMTLANMKAKNTPAMLKRLIRPLVSV